MNENQEFWNIVGTPLDWRQLKVGEVFLLERGAVRQIMEVVSMGEDSFECRLAFGKELPPQHRVLVMADD